MEYSNFYKAQFAYNGILRKLTQKKPTLNSMGIFAMITGCSNLTQRLDGFDGPFGQNRMNCDLLKPKFLSATHF